jgi:hypothetical protein
MREASVPAIGRIGRALHETFDEMVHAPLPERWIDMINRLNAEEEAIDSPSVARSDRRRENPGSVKLGGHQIPPRIMRTA